MAWRRAFEKRGGIYLKTSLFSEIEDWGLLWVSNMWRGLLWSTSWCLGLSNGQRCEGDDISPQVPDIRKQKPAALKMWHEGLTFKSEKTFGKLRLPPQGINCPKKMYRLLLLCQLCKATNVFIYWTERQDDGTDDFPRSHLIFWPGEPVSNLERPCLLPWCDIEQLPCFFPLGQIQR